MVPTSTGKPGKLRKLFPVREKSENFEETENVNPNTGKMSEFYSKHWKSEEILASFILLFIFFCYFDFLVEVPLLFLYLLNNVPTQYWKMKRKYWNVREICQSENVGTMRRY